MKGKEQSLVETVDYDPDTDTYSADFTPGTIEASSAIVAALSLVRRCDSSDMRPLYESIDTDSLDTLIDGASSETTVTFDVEGFTVAVQAAGTIEITPPEQS